MRIVTIKNCFSNGVTGYFDARNYTCVRCTIETKEVAHIVYNGLLFPHEYSGEGRGA